MSSCSVLFVVRVAPFVFRPTVFFAPFQIDVWSTRVKSIDMLLELFAACVPSPCTAHSVNSSLSQSWVCLPSAKDHIWGAGRGTHCFEAIVLKQAWISGMLIFTSIERPVLRCASREGFLMLHSSVRLLLTRYGLSPCLLTSDRHLLPPRQWATRFIPLSNALQGSELEQGNLFLSVQLANLVSFPLWFDRPRGNHNYLLFLRLSLEESRLWLVDGQSSRALISRVLWCSWTLFDVRIDLRSSSIDLSARFELPWIESVIKSEGMGPTKLCLTASELRAVVFALTFAYSGFDFHSTHL